MYIDTVAADDGNDYVQILVAGAVGHVQDEGYPDLPVRSLQIIIPYGKKVENVTYSNIESQEFSINKRVYPVENYRTMTPFFAAPDTIIYNSSNCFPISPIVRWEQHYFDYNNNIVAIGVCPFQYYPLNGFLRFITSLTITVEYSDDEQKELQRIKRLPETQKLYDSLMYDIVDNKNMIPAYKSSNEMIGSLGQTLSGLPVYEYVVVTPQVFVPYLADFVKWKNQKGIRTGTVSIEDIIYSYPDGDEIGSYPIRDAAGSLRQYLHDANVLGTSYALLVGDPNPSDSFLPEETFMPYRYGYTKPNASADSNWLVRPTTDWYFSDLVGDWNKDDDAFYGEPIEDAPNPYANVMVGRLICSSSQDIKNWIEKLLIYEMNPGKGNPDYVINSLITRADNIGSCLYWDNLPHYHHVVMEETPGCLDPNPITPIGSYVISELNENRYGLMTWFNHGGTNHQHSCMLSMTANVNSNGSSFSRIWKLYSDMNCIDNNQLIQPDYNNSLDYMTNFDDPMIVYAMSCNVIPFDHTKSNSISNSRNCGESFTVGGKYGGVAFLGNTLDAYGYRYFIEFALKLNMAYENNYLSHLGPLEAHSKYYNNYSQNWSEHHYKHNLIGDPECQIWTDIPDRLLIETVEPNVLVKEVNSQVKVVVSGFNTDERQRFCTITLLSNGDVFKTVEIPVNSDGLAEVVFDSIFPTTTGAVSITAISYNHLPAQKYLPVIEECESEIYTNVTWSDDLSMDCDVIINPNATLTIKSKVLMNVNNKIKVLPGGKLIIDGGTIGCSVPGCRWQGIRVLGNGVSGWQGMTYGSYAQGFVCLKNNAEIKDARVAVDLWDGIHLYSTGGIVNASDALFNNNGIAVRAMQYKNTNPVNGKEYNYNARFYNCDFVVDSDYPEDDVIFRHHIELSKVKGVRFAGCRFAVNNCLGDLMSEDNSAIFVYNGGMSVDRYCSNSLVLPCPEEDFIPSMIEGFSIGVNASNSFDCNSVITVKNTIFRDNALGIHALNDINLTVLFSSFLIGEGESCSIGISLENTPTFCIEENDFYSYPGIAGDIDCFGIVINNTHSSNTIYRNTFSNLTCGVLADGVNRNGITSGLSFSCNINNNNDVDFFIPSCSLVTPNYGVSLFQGDELTAVGNVFSQNQVRWQFYNGNNDIVTYYYNRDNLLEDPQSNYCFNLRKIAAQNANDCPSNYTNNSNVPLLSTNDKRQKEMSYYNAYTNYYNVKALYDSYIDAGNTAEELENLRDAGPSDMWELRSRLLGISPYLSQELLLALADLDDVFPKSVLFEIFASNPEELGRDSLLSYLNNNTNMPEYMMAILNQMADNASSYRSVLESQMSLYKREYRSAANDVVRSILNDSIVEAQELRDWLANLETITADRQIIASYFEEGNDSIAFALANMLPMLYELDGDALQEHEGYMDMLILYHTLENQNRTVYELSDKEMFMVDSIANYGIGISQSMAKSIKEIINGITNRDCPRFQLVNDFNRGRSTYSGYSEWRDGVLNTLISMSVSPNPANNWTEIDYCFPDNIDKGRLQIMSLLGRKMADFELHGNKGKSIIDLRSIPSGTYLCIINCGTFSNTEKLVIIK